MKTNELMIGDVVRFRSDQWSTDAAILHDRNIYISTTCRTALLDLERKLTTTGRLKIKVTNPACGYYRERKKTE